MVSNRFFIVVLLVFATLSLECGKNLYAQPKKLFTLPTIPSAIASVEGRQEYLAQHYWDNFNFDNQELLKNDSLMGVAIGGYIQVLMMNRAATIERSVDTTLSRALKSGYHIFEMFSSKLEEYLYNPNSPMRNEELYLFVLRYMVDRAPLEDIYKIRPRKQLEMVMKNRLGDVATDFDFEYDSGRTSTLHAIKAQYTILFFNTPDCNDCTRVKEYIGNSPHLTKLVERGDLTILAIYTERDFDLWRRSKYPATVTNTADTKGEIARNRLYDLKALPTLYLLDNEKKILLKDRTIEQCERYLIN